MNTAAAIIKRVLPTLVLLMVSVGYAMAQDPGGPGGPPDGVLVPIDGGLSILLAAGAAYGAKKIHASRTKNKVQNVD